MRRCLVFIFSFSYCISAYSAHASEGLQTLFYDVYAGGMHVVEGKLIIDSREKSRYSLVLEAHTRGFLGSLAPWRGIFESHGWALDDGTYRPELHKSVTTWRKEDEISEYKYNQDGSFEALVITEHDKKPEIKIPDAELTKDTLDVLTATLMVLQKIRGGGECSSSSDIFDGKRRFKQVFAHQDFDELRASKYNVYDGKAAQCTIEVVPVAGKWHEKPRGWMSIQEQGRERGTMPTVWMAPMGENVPAVPVKIRVKTSYGTLFMHLTEYRDEYKTLMTKKRKKKAKKAKRRAEKEASKKEM